MKKAFAVTTLIVACLFPLALQESATEVAIGEGEAPAMIELNPAAEPEASPPPSDDAAMPEDDLALEELLPVESPEPTPAEIAEEPSPDPSVEEIAVEFETETTTETEAAAEPTPVALAATSAADDSQAELDRVLAELDAASGKVVELEERIDALTAEVAIGKAALAQSGSKNLALEGEITKLEGEIASLRNERSGLVGAKVIDAWDFDRSAFSKTIASGFDGAKPATGSWTISANKATQNDGKEFFAKLRMPVSQGKKRTLYSFTARGGPKGWTGVGLHFYISGKTVRYSYGEGKSLLLWFTRDPASYNDLFTHLQLYRSDGLVNMEQVFSGEITGDMAKAFKIEIIYDPVREYVLVAVDGSVRVVYKTFFGIGEGVGVALRTLGPGCEFSDFIVKSEP